MQVSALLQSCRRDLVVLVLELVVAVQMAMAVRWLVSVAGQMVKAGCPEVAAGQKVKFGSLVAQMPCLMHLVVRPYRKQKSQMLAFQMPRSAPRRSIDRMRRLDQAAKASRMLTLSLELRIDRMLMLSREQMVARMLVSAPARTASRTQNFESSYWFVQMLTLPLVKRVFRMQIQSLLLRTVRMQAWNLG
jgi:hypothetical protein